MLVFLKIKSLVFSQNGLKVKDVFFSGILHEGVHTQRLYR